MLGLVLVPVLVAPAGCVDIEPGGEHADDGGGQDQHEGQGAPGEGQGLGRGSRGGLSYAIRLLCVLCVFVLLSRVKYCMHVLSSH